MKSRLLFGLLLGFSIGALARVHADLPQLGVFVGGPHLSDATAEAGLDERYAAFKTLMGQDAKFTDVFTDYTQAIKDWPGSARWGSGQLKGSSISHLIPVVSVGLADKSVYDSGKRNEAKAIAMMNAVGAGTYDDIFNGVIDAYRKNGFTKIYLRIGWEMNGGWEPWYATGSPEAAAAYAKAFQRVATLAHQAQGMTIKTVWCPCFVQWTKVDVTTTYPGNEAVDIIGPDAYSPVWPPDKHDWSTNADVADRTTWAANPVNREHYWDYPSGTKWKPTNGWGLPAALAFTKEHKKPFALSETGAGGDDKERGPKDDDAFPAYLGKRLSAAVADGTPMEYFVIWDLNPKDGSWLFTDGSKPKLAAAWKQFVDTMTAAVAPAPTAPTQ